MRINIYCYAIVVAISIVTVSAAASSSTELSLGKVVKKDHTKKGHTKKGRTKKDDQDSPRTKKVKKTYPDFRASPSAEQVLPTFRISKTTSVPEALCTLAPDDKQETSLPATSVSKSSSPVIFSQSTASPKSERMSEQRQLELRDGISNQLEISDLHRRAVLGCSCSGDDLTKLAATKVVAQPTK